jgi:hypothetical protein
MAHRNASKDMGADYVVSLRQQVLLKWLPQLWGKRLFPNTLFHVGKGRGTQLFSRSILPEYRIGDEMVSAHGDRYAVMFQYFPKHMFIYVSGV